MRLYSTVLNPSSNWRFWIWKVFGIWRYNSTFWIRYSSAYLVTSVSNTTSSINQDMENTFYSKKLHTLFANVTILCMAFSIRKITECVALPGVILDPKVRYDPITYYTLVRNLRHSPETSHNNHMLSICNSYSTTLSPTKLPVHHRPGIYECDRINFVSIITIIAFTRSHISIRAS